ncbi:MAG: hypothetical protein ACFFBV_16395 [Promethearchaeota archaeon]
MPSSLPATVVGREAARGAGNPGKAGGIWGCKPRPSYGREG